ncbi:SDR family NAD(P)-dependent oxidoreductase [Sphingomonas sp.]|jgi:NAD(P)-dependent dehydrogenase (short-subunit alcohol dehydrogenase family)|uniref:SDR family NAD(P)-dependent oxidoreductase n=1 Tax=Sphingomonas sp. TaxID=28214 RepID=UPI002E352B55|nr:SDR family NAD(P)-dependent oxidoreductase [Sphingomonas sp.]HEX4693871.1 SDR family NAD(P)-dependent oxidoreductase [Sphingomonas sp.]
MARVVRTVLVTGGARRIGAAIVRALAEAGHRVVIHHHRSHDEDAAALARELDPVAERVATVNGDLAEPDAATAILQASRNIMNGPIDGLVNCASVFEFDRPPSFDPALLADLMRVNLAAPVALACALAGQDDLIDGAVVNLLDQKVANLNPDFFSYTCTKIALEGATTMLAQALAPRVRVNAVSPGLTLPSGDQSDTEFASVSGQNLLERPVPIAELGRAVEYLLTAPAVTGQNLFVDNGQRFLKRQGDVMFSTPGRRDG